MNGYNYLFYKFQQWYILGKIESCSKEYTGRTNYLAQFFALDSSELQECGPADILGFLPFMKSFEGEARLLPPCVIPVVPSLPRGLCNQWANVTGDAGWGGALAEKLRTDQTALILYDISLHGTKCLALIGEALSLLMPVDRWNITFSTHVNGFPKGNQVRLRMLQEGSGLSNEFKANPQCINLTRKQIPPAIGGDLVTAARTGVYPEGKLPLDNSAPPSPDASAHHLAISSTIINPPFANFPGRPSSRVSVPSHEEPPPLNGYHDYGVAAVVPSGSESAPQLETAQKKQALSLLVYCVSLATGILVSGGFGFLGGIQINRQGIDEITNKAESLAATLEKKNKELNQKSMDWIFDSAIKQNELEIADKQIISQSNIIKTYENENKGILPYKEFTIRLSESMNLRNLDEKNLISTTENEVNKFIELRKKYNLTEESCKKAFEFDIKKENILKEAYEVNKIEYNQSDDMKNLLKYNSQLQDKLKRKEDQAYEYLKEHFEKDTYVSNFINKYKIARFNQEMSKEEKEKEAKLSTDNFKDFVRAFGEASDSQTNYKNFDKDFFSKKQKELGEEKKESSKELINVALVFFIKEFKKNAIFCRDKKFIIQRYKYLQENWENIIKYSKDFKEAIKQTKEIDITEKDINNFTNYLNELFGKPKPQ